MNTDQAFPIFFGVWMALSIAGFLLFYVRRDVSFKRRFFPWYVGLASILFLGFMLFSGVPLPVLAIFAPFVALIAWLNINGTQFCDACGKTIMQQMPFSRPEFCSTCGASLRTPTNGVGPDEDAPSGPTTG